MGSPLNINDSDFRAEVLEAEMPVLVDFWAVWCGPCRMIAPTVKDIAAEYGDYIKVTKLNIDHNPETAGRYGVMGIPTLMLFKNGQVVDRIVGVMPKDAIVSRVLQHVDMKAAA